MTDKQKETFEQILAAGSEQVDRDPNLYNPKHAKRKQIPEISAGEYILVGAVALIVILGFLFLG